MAELTEQQIEHLKKLNAQAVKEVMTDKGNIAFLNASIKKFIDDLKEQNKDCEPAAYMMSGAIMGYTLCLYNKEKELKNAYFLRDEEQKRNSVLEQRLKEEISKNQIFDNAIYKIAKMVKPYKENPYKYTPKDYYCLLNQIQELIEVVIVQTTEEEYKGGEGDGSST